MVMVTPVGILFGIIVLGSIIAVSIMIAKSMKK